MNKKILLLSALGLLTMGTVNAQTTLFEDSFEDYPNFAIANIGDWTLFDGDQADYNYTIQDVEFPGMGEIPSFIVFNPSATTPALDETANAKTGSKYMAAFASYNVPETTPVPVVQSDWMISPQINLGSSGNKVVFWAKSHTLQYGPEKFKVLISSTNTEVGSFTAISSGTSVSADSDQWTEYSYDIPATYDNEAVYIAIQCVSNDSFIFAVDDFKVTSTGTVSTEEFFKTNFSLYPNPATDVLNIQSKNGWAIENISIIDISGRTVKTQKGSESINVSDLASGTYMIDIVTKEGKATSKFIKK